MLFKSEKKCIHRHNRNSHPKCFDSIGNPIVKNKSLPVKILLFDIETLPMTVFVWGLYKQRIPPDSVINDFTVLSWSAKWLFDSRIQSDALTSEEAINKDDRRVVENIWKLLNEADIVIAHNAKGFDIGKLNARFLLHGFPPPTNYKIVDTLSVLRKEFKISSNTLDYATKFLGLDQKTHPGFDIWKKCFYGDKSALKDIKTYNENDVLILEELYVKIRPWITNHPNLGLYFNTTKPICPNCGSSKLTWHGTYKTQLGEYKAFRCECGAVGRSRTNEAKGKVLVK